MSRKKPSKDEVKDVLSRIECTRLQLAWTMPPQMVLQQNMTQPFAVEDEHKEEELRLCMVIEATTTGGYLGLWRSL